jgi:hypothetical protein
MKGPDFTVDLNSEIGWTIVYEDPLGRLLFVFEPGDQPKTVSLDVCPLADNKVVTITEHNRPRIDLAVERSVAFLKSCGYEVQTHD